MWIQPLKLLMTLENVTIKYMFTLLLCFVKHFLQYQ
jgi:hypothetical protein